MTPATLAASCAALGPALPDDLRVPRDAPPLFVLCANDDPLLSPLTNAVRIYSLWKLAGIPAELHVYTKGGHGFGMEKRGLPARQILTAYMDKMRAAHQPILRQWDKE